MFVGGFAFVLTLAGLSLADGGVLSQAFTGGLTVGVTYLVSFVVALGILIFVHELGHFLVAKAAGVGVERFSLGFGPRLWSIRRGETEYCLSIIPLGGYVKMVGEEAAGEDAIHPATDTSRETLSDPRKSFVLKPLWVRSLVVFAGPAMNIVLAVLIYSVIFATAGIPVLPTTLGLVAPDSPAAQAGLQAGDRILAVDGRPVRHWTELVDRIGRSDGRPLRLTVERGGERREAVVTPRRAVERNVFNEPVSVWSIGITKDVPPVVGEVLPGMPAAEAGLQPGDRVLAIDGRPIRTWDEMAEAIGGMPGKPVALTVERNGERREVSVTPRAVTETDLLGREKQVGRIGISQVQGPVMSVRLGPLAALGEGARRTWDLMGLTIMSMWKLVTGAISASNIGGPLQIGIVAGKTAQQGLIPYALFLGLISVNLAVLNLLPVPMLDGGHLLFFAIEAVLGRPLSLRKREIAQQIGLALIVLLMAFALYNDSRLIPVGKLFK